MCVTQAGLARLLQDAAFVIPEVGVCGRYVYSFEGLILCCTGDFVAMLRVSHSGVITLTHGSHRLHPTMQSGQHLLTTSTSDAL